MAKIYSEKGEMMFLDDVCEVQNDPDREARNHFHLIWDFRNTK